jgi:predicted dehydrogenase
VGKIEERQVTAPLRIGVVGAGYFARYHHDAWLRIPDVEVSAVADLDGEKANVVSAEFGIPNTYRTLGEMLAADRFDLIDIATPPDTHLDAIRQTAAAGIDTICQKPFCGGLADAETATGITKDAGIRLIVHENFRYQPWYQAIAGVLSDGTLGEVYQLQFRLRPGDGQGPDAYLGRQPYFQKMPRFLVHETAVHLIDVFRFLLGEPDTVYADLMRWNPAIAGEDAGVIILGFANGPRAIFDGNRLVDHVAENRRLTMGELWLDAERGTIRLDGNGRVYVREHGADIETPVPFSWADKGFGGDCVYLFQCAAVDALRTGTATGTEADVYLKNLRIVDAAYRANETGQRVVLSHD